MTLTNVAIYDNCTVEDYVIEDSEVGVRILYNFSISGTFLGNIAFFRFKDKFITKSYVDNYIKDNSNSLVSIFEFETVDGRLNIANPEDVEIKEINFFKRIACFKMGTQQFLETYENNVEKINNLCNEQRSNARG